MVKSRTVLGTLLVVFVALLAVSAAEAEEQKIEKEYVWTLDHTNYSDIISQHKMIVVEFYRLTCGHCRALAPKYERAAQVLSSHDPPIILAKMDTSSPENREFSKDYTRTGVPSIKIFRDGGKIVHGYKGTHEEEGIISYLKKHAGPASLEIKSKEDATSLIDEKRIVVAGIFSELFGEKFQNFTALAEHYRVDYDFVHTLDATLLPHGGPVDKPTIRLLKAFDELYVDFENFDLDAMENFIEEASVPIVAILDENPINQAFVTNFLRSSQAKAMLFVNFSTDLDAYKSKYHELAVSYKGKGVKFLLADVGAGKKALEYFGFSTDQAPLIILLSTDNIKYGQRRVQPDRVAAWVKDFLDGKLKPYLKSQPIPEVNDEPVKVVVADTFDDMVLDSGKDVLLEFFRPGCPDCEAFAPTFDEVALSFEKDPDVLLAKINIWENDIPAECDIQDLPTLYFKSATGNLSKFEGDRTKEALIEFLQKNRATPAPSTYAKSDSIESEKVQTNTVKDEL